MQSALPRLFVFCLACFFLGAAPSFAEQRLDASALQNALAVPGTVVLIRHSATFSGIGDPDNFRLEDCSTQRNLSPEGRAQARAFGQWFRDRGLTPSAVRSSQWCRCLDTATEAFRGQPSTQPWLDKRKSKLVDPELEYASNHQGSGLQQLSVMSDIPHIRQGPDYFSRSIPWVILSRLNYECA